MSDTGSAVPLTVELSEQSVIALTNRIADALGRGVRSGLSDANSPLNQWISDLTRDFLVGFTQATRQSARVVNDFIQDAGNAGEEAGQQAGRNFAFNFARFMQNLNEATDRTVRAMTDAFGPAIAEIGTRMRILTDGAVRGALRLEETVTSGRTRGMRDSEIRAQMLAVQRQGAAASMDIQAVNTAVAAEGRQRAKLIRQQTEAEQAAARERLQAQRDAAREATRQATQDARDLFETQRQLNKLETIDAREQAKLRVAADAAAAKATEIQQREASRARLLDAQNAARLQTDAARAAAKQRLQAEKAGFQQEAIEARAAADQATAAAKVAGQRRLAITKGLVRGILALEKGLGAAIQGIARTIISVFNRAMSTVKSLVTGTVSALTAPFRRANNGINQGLDSALSQRTGMFRRSFAEQEQVVKRSVQRQQAQMQQLNQRTSTGVLGAVTGRGMGGGLAALAGGFSIAAFMKSGYQEAVNLNEQINKNRVLFGQSADAVIKFADNSVRAFGATKSEALEAAGTFGNLFRASKMSEEQSAMMSTTLVQLAGDLSSFNNVPINEVFDALRSGLVGETEPLRRLGVMLNETVLKAKALELGFGDGKKTLDANAKAMAAYALIMEQTTLAQGDFARTSNEGANAQRVMGKAAKELAASIMSKLLPIATVAINAMSKAFMVLTAFIKNDTNPVLNTLKRALMGIAIGVGAALAIKTLVEAFKLLGPAIKLALSPMGIFLVIAGAIGAAIALMTDKTKGVKDIFKMLGDVLSTVFEKVKSVVVPVLAAIGRVIMTYVVPAVKKAVVFIEGYMLVAFNALVGFIRDEVVPAFYLFVAFLTTRVWPAIKRIGSLIADAFGATVRGIKAFFSALVPLMQPAIDGVKQLVKAIGSLFSGDSSKMGEGAGGFFSGIVTSLGNIVSKIGELLAPVAKTVLAWFKGLFSPANIKMIISGILTFVETVGYVIGTIVSHPNFVKAVAALAAAAVVIGGKFIIGFGRGVIDNLPGLLGMIWDAFLAGLMAIWDNKGVFLMIVAGVVAAMPMLKALFGKAGSDAGSGFFGGLKKSAVGVLDFMRGTARAAGREVEREQQVFKKRLAEINRDRRVMGAGTISFGARPITEKALKAAEKDLRALQEGYSKAQLAGMRFRATVEQQVASFKKLAAASAVVVRGVGTMVKGLGQAAMSLAGQFRGGGTSAMQALQNGFSIGAVQVQTGFRRFWGELKKIAKEQGTSVGAVAGQTLANAAVAAIGGFMAGKAAGEAGGIGAGVLTSALSGLTAGLATGNAVVGVATAGFGLLGSAIGAAKKETQQFQAFIKSFSDSFKSDLVAAVEQGNIALGALRSGLNFSDVVASTGGAASIASQIASNLNTDVLATLAGLDINIGRDIVPSLVAADGDVQKFSESFQKSMFEAQASSDEFKTAFGNDSGAVSGYLTQMMANGEGLANLQTRVTTLTQEIGGATQNNMDSATLALKRNELALVQLMVTNSEVIRPMFDTNKAVKDQAKAVFEAAKEASDYAQVTADLEKAAANATDEFHGLGNAMKSAGSRDLQTNLDEVAKRIEILGKNSEEAKALIDELFDFGGGNFQNTVDDALIAVDQLGQRIADNLADGSDVGAAKARENLRTLGTNLSEVIKAGVDEGTILNPADAMRLTKGIFDAATAGLDPGSEAYKKIAEQYNAALAGVQPVLDAAKATQQAARFQMLVQEYLDTHPNSTLVEAEVAIKNREITAEVTAKLTVARVELSTKTGQSAERNPEAFAAGLFGNWAKGIDIPAKVKVEPPLSKDVRDDFVPIGKAADEGVKKGVRDNKQIVIAEMRRLALDAKQAAEFALGIRSPSKVFGEIGKNVVVGFAEGVEDHTARSIKATTDMAINAIETARDELGVQSPSTVFKDIGKDVMLGFADGMEGGAQAAADAARTAVQTVVDAAIAGVDAGKAAMTSATQTLFAAMTGSDAAAIGGGGPLAAITALGSITTATQSFQSQVASAAQTAWDTAMKNPSEMTAADLNILGESYVSLNATDVLGAQNLASLTSVLDSISSYGETLIGQGRPVQEVIDIVNQQVDAFYDMAVGMGFNATQLSNLIDQLGLSGEALNAFMQQVADIGEEAANTQPNRLPYVPVVTTPAVNTTTATASTSASTEAKSGTMQVTKSQTNNITVQLPYGDPQAVALAVANKVAVLV